MRVVRLFTIGLVVACGGAGAQELVATRPGVMCHAAGALGKLTLPDGDSRTHLAAQRPGDAAVAKAGGCIDIPPGARVRVRQAFHNTSIVEYGAAGAAPYVVPNIDFRPAGASEAAAQPTGYEVVQRLVLPGAGALVLEEDRRLTADLRKKLWGTGGPDIALDPGDPLVTQVREAPLLNARLELRSAGGSVLATMATQYPLARLEVAPIHGLPAPAIMFTVDESAGMGGFSGPETTFLGAASGALTPMRTVSETDGRSHDMVFATTLHAGWRIVPSGTGAPEMIESAYCPGGNEVQVLRLWTDRFQDGRWHRAERRGEQCADLEEMPPRAAFP